MKKLQKFTMVYGRPPTYLDFCFETPCNHTISDYFGGWINALKKAGLDITDNIVYNTRMAEEQQISEFKNEDTILSGQNRHSTCDGICPKGDMFDTKSSCLKLLWNNCYGWQFCFTIGQLLKAKYFFLRGYKDKFFSKPPLHIWRVPVKFIDNRRGIYILNDDITGQYNIITMKEYEVL